MKQEPTATFSISFPGDIEYIPSLRKFVSDVLIASSFTAKFAYRSEIIVDEICNNAVLFGCRKVEAVVELHCMINDKQIEFVIKDEGGNEEDKKKLQLAINQKTHDKLAPDEFDTTKKLGLEIVRMVSDEIDFHVDGDNLTHVRVVKCRDEAVGETEKNTVA